MVTFKIVCFILSFFVALYSIPRIICWATNTKPQTTPAEARSTRNSKTVDEAIEAKLARKAGRQSGEALAAPLSVVQAKTSHDIEHRDYSALVDEELQTQAIE
jgi:hypothetical protein